MSDPREVVLDWAAQGRIAPAALARALALAGVLPDAEGWRRFLDRWLLSLGTVLVAAGVIFFIAANWDAIGRYARFALAQGVLLAALAGVWHWGPDRPAGRAAVLGCALFTGALLALIGQTYQTGADTWELFATWAALILPWVLLGRSPGLWLLWLALLNIAVVLYLRTFPGLFGLLMSTERLLWLLFLLDTAALLLWELAGLRLAWLRPRWAPRLLASASGGLVTALALVHIFDAGDGSAWGLAAWLAWLVGAGGVYRYRRPDLFVLAGGVLSLVLVLAGALADALDMDEPLGLLLVGLLVIGLSAAGGQWLRAVAREQAP